MKAKALIEADDEPEPTMADAKALLREMPRPSRYLAQFHPQVWEDDWAVPPTALDVRPMGPTEWDATDFMNTLPEEIRVEILRSIETGRVRDENDELIRDPAAPDWIREWEGPFDITVSSNRLDPISGLWR